MVINTMSPHTKACIISVLALALVNKLYRAVTPSH